MFYKVDNLFLHQSYLKHSTPSQISLCKKTFFIIEKIQKYRKCPALRSSTHLARCAWPRRRCCPCGGTRCSSRPASWPACGRTGATWSPAGGSRHSGACTQLKEGGVVDQGIRAWGVWRSLRFCSVYEKVTVPGHFRYKNNLPPGKVYWNNAPSVKFTSAC